MSRHSSIRTIIACLTCTILLLDLFNARCTAIPAKNYAAPEDVVSSARRIFLRSPRHDIVDTDVLCRYHHILWWKAYKVKRAKAFQVEGKRADPLFQVPYAYYSDELGDIPVEAIDGEVWDHTKKGSHVHTHKNGCYHGCQDIRSTHEWIIAAVIDNKHQVRAKWTYVMPCPAGMYPEEYQKPSRRVKIVSEAAEADAYKLLTLKRFAALGTDENIYGDDSETVRGCRCRKLDKNEEIRRSGLSDQIAVKSEPSMLTALDRTHTLPQRMLKRRINKLYWTADQERNRRLYVKKTKLQEEADLRATIADIEEASRASQPMERADTAAEHDQRDTSVCKDLASTSSQELDPEFPEQGTDKAGSPNKDLYSLGQDFDDRIHVTISDFGGIEVPSFWWDDLNLGPISLTDPFGEKWE